MSKVKIIFIAIIVLVIASVLWYALSPLFMNIVADDPLPTTGEPVSQTLPLDRPSEEAPREEEVLPASIVPTSAHPASGTVRVVTDAAGRYLRYENYKTINGPDLRVYLATDTSAKDFVDLGPLKATEGNVNYPIPTNTDLNKYRYALTWCEDFSVLFNSALLPVKK